MQCQAMFSLLFIISFSLVAGMTPAGPAFAAEESDTTTSDVVRKTATEPQADLRPQLSEEMAALRDRVRRTIRFYYGQPLNTRNNTVTDVLHFSTAFGCGTEIRAGSASGKKISGIGTLAWNYPCAGYRLFGDGDGAFVPRVGYGLERGRGQFLATLAMSKVSKDYELRDGDSRGTVADVVRAEQHHCQSGTDQSFVLIGLAHYLPDGATWKNNAGQTWTLERLVREELDRKTDLATPEATYRLMGLSAAVNHEPENNQPLEGQLARAEEYIRKFEDHALVLQNDDGTWHPLFFDAQGTSRDTRGVLRSSGHILEWLAMSIAEDRLEDPRIVKAVDRVNNLLAAESSRRYLYASSPRDLETLLHAASALAIYDQRVFKPCDPAEDEAGDETTPL